MKLITWQSHLRPTASVRCRPAPTILLAGCVAVSGCGGSANTGFTNDGPPSDAASETSATSDATASIADAGAPAALFTKGDASAAMSTGACKPGTYVGTFTTSASVPDGGLLDLFSFDWSGMLSVTLQGKMSTTQAGEFSMTTLVIAPGATISGSDQYGGTFTSGVSGQLDCPSRAFVGTLENGTYSNPNALGLFPDGGSTIAMVGTLSGAYDPGTTPASLGGSMSVSSPDVQNLVATGTWSAQLQ